jgi:diamine N-acetyltransferase
MDSHEPDFIVVGEKVALGPLRRDLAAAYARWMNQLEVRRGLDQMGIATRRAWRSGWRRTSTRARSASPKPSSSRSTTRTDSMAVGTAGLFEIADANGTAEFVIAIGERRGQGLGTEATRLVLDFAFHEAAQCAARDAGVERRGVDGRAVGDLRP